MPSRPTSPATQNRVIRTKTLGVEIVQNRNGWFIGTSWSGVPSKTLGPFEGPLSFPEALALVIVDMQLDK